MNENVFIEQFMICGYCYEYQCNHETIHNYILELLETHSIKNNFHVDFSVCIKKSFPEDDSLEHGQVLLFETKKVKTFHKKMESFQVWVDVEKINEMESLYYHLLSPLITKTLCYKGLFYLHGACMEIHNKGIIFLGIRNSGKSTLSIVNLLAGSRFLTDDCIFLDDELVAQTLYRPIHIDPALGEVLNIQDRISSNDKYLSKEKEVNYYQKKYHADQLVDKLKAECVVFLRLSKEKKAEKIPMTIAQVKEEIGNYMGDYQQEKLVELLSHIPAYHLTWGEEELNNPFLLQELLKDVAGINIE